MFHDLKFASLLHNFLRRFSFLRIFGIFCYPLAIVWVIFFLGSMYSGMQFRIKMIFKL